MPRPVLLGLVLVLALQAPALARIGGKVEEVRKLSDRPDVHHVTLWLDHGVIVQETWWCDPEHRWTLAQGKQVQALIAGDLAVKLDWRSGAGVADDLKTLYADGSAGSIAFVGADQVESVAIRGSRWDDKQADGYEDLQLDVADDRAKR